MNFTSQICTTKEQSERLLALGLKKETADMALHKNHFGKWLPSTITECPFDDLIFPAWSLHRLIEMCPLISNPLRFLAVTSFKTVYVKMNDEMDVCYGGKGTYNNLIDCIGWLIKEGHFNKEYLEE